MGSDSSQAAKYFTTETAAAIEMACSGSPIPPENPSRTSVVKHMVASGNAASNEGRTVLSLVSSRDRRSGGGSRLRVAVAEMTTQISRLDAEWPSTSTLTRKNCVGDGIPLTT